MTKHETLKHYFGHEQFREGQEAIIDQLLQGRDALCVMPTGAGKSICYQIPALMLDGVTLVISPLISLMKDQVNALTQSGVRAAYINRSLTLRQYETVLERTRQGTYKIIYVSPERLTVDRFLDSIAHLEISMLAVDEAHCISQWGQDFRPSYMKIQDFIQLLPRRPIVSAFTATATQEVKDDIASTLCLTHPLRITTGFDRPNLQFAVKAPQNKESELRRMLEQFQQQSGIIYCATRKTVEALCDSLHRRGYPVTRYHAGLSDEERQRNQDDFVCDRSPLMVATNAFGMGIDKSNVSFVIHYNMPKNLESYYQEAGRAGRDGSPATCTLLYSPQDVRTNQFLMSHADPNPELSAETQAIIRSKEQERLKHITFYSTTTDCLRDFMLKYFGEKTHPFCGNCSNCNIGFQSIDVTWEAQQILSCVSQIGQRFGVRMVMDILHGSQNERIRSLGLDRHSTYGSLAKIPVKTLRQIINLLLLQDLAQLTEGEYPVLMLTERSHELVQNGQTLELKIPLEQERSLKKKTEKTWQLPDSDLFAQLKTLRTSLANEAHVPAYIIFTDATLSDMCQKLPQSPDAFLQVSGVGQAKLEKYGTPFLQAISTYLAQAHSTPFVSNE